MSGQDLVADGLTKSLQGQSFQRFKEKLCLVGQRVSAVVKKAIGGGSVGTVEAEEQKKVWRDRATIVLAAAGGALISAGRVVSGCMLILGLLGSQKAMQAWKHLGGQGDAEKPKMMVLRALQPEEEPESRGTEGLQGSVTEERAVDPWIEAQDNPMQGPWRRPIFAQATTGRQDQWGHQSVAPGWLVRYHVKMRKQSFDPRRASMPLDASRLTGRRMTVKFRGEDRELWEDDLFASRGWTDREQWKGYTFLEVTPLEDREFESGSVSGLASSPSTGSLEFLDVNEGRP